MSVVVLIRPVAPAVRRWHVVWGWFLWPATLRSKGCFAHTPAGQSGPCVRCVSGRQGHFTEACLQNTSSNPWQAWSVWGNEDWGQTGAVFRGVTRWRVTPSHHVGCQAVNVKMNNSQTRPGSGSAVSTEMASTTLSPALQKKLMQHEPAWQDNTCYCHQIKSVLTHCA